ncbi:MAG: molybdopterin molybdotransferase MoeA [Defluviitaleaceae bacterium]|nr:molybdopterin molybdotransferase MoeA [Defluviitaleaceae bacterium]
MNFLKVDTIENAREKLLKVTPKLKIENISIHNLLGRIVAEDIISNENIPYFRRSIVDGYAVISEDTEKSSKNFPTFIENIGYIDIGTITNINLEKNKCCYVYTGSMVPNGADSVVMVENTEKIDKKIAIYKKTSKNENIVNIGDDVKINEIVIKKGTKISEKHIGLLMALGIMQVSVYVPLNISIISTGEELVNPQKEAINGKIRDINTYSLKSFSEKNYYNVITTSLICDNSDLEEKIESLKTSDIIIISGGSSKGLKDNSLEIVQKTTNNGVFTYGLALKPGKPTIISYDEISDTIICCLPGNPVSSLVVFEMLFSWLSLQITNTKKQFPIYANITQDVFSDKGKLTVYPCRLIQENVSYKAEPIFAKSAFISSLSNADGYFIINAGESIKKGNFVSVILL